MKILCITEEHAGKWNKVSFEALVAAQQIVQQTGGTLSGVVIGKGISVLAEHLRGLTLDEVLVAEHALLEQYTPDSFSIALRQVVEFAKPDLVLLPHTYQVRDFAPKLAASMGKGMVGDCVGYRYENGQLIFMRRMLQGRAVAEVAFIGDGPWIVSLQASAFSAEQLAKHASGRAPVRSITVEIKPEQIRTRPLDLFREGKQAVDLTQSRILVSIGRGIKAPENIALAERLAKAIGGEICASRPVCDEGWLPMDRQIGSSGQTVAPKLYFALGISGAIQHAVGMKSAGTIAAINNDRNAPIFEIADYGVVGDLFEIVPALIEEVEKI